MKTIRLMGAPVDSGGPTPGCLMGPEALRQAGLPQTLARQGRRVIDQGDLACLPASAVSHPNPAIRHLATGAQWIRDLQTATYAIADGQGIPFIMGGDHLMAAGTIPALSRRAAERKRPLFVLWLDAHTDFHTLASTETGNLHGIPAAYVCGQPGFDDVFPPLEVPLAPENLCMLGIRSVDPAEQAQMQALQTTVIDMASLEREGVAALLQSFLGKVRAAGGELHLSFDVDCLDPAIAPGVGTRVADGVSYKQAEQIMLLLHGSQLLTSVEIAELNPLLDQGAQSAQVMVGLINTLFNGETVATPGPVTATPSVQNTPADGSTVAWLSVSAMRDLVQRTGIEHFLRLLGERIEADFQRWPDFDKTARIPAHSPDGVIELMPASDTQRYAFKYVNGHPVNAGRGLQTVTAFGCLADVDTGYPLLLSEMTLLTALRTAATSATASRHLARRDASCMAIIGNGAQSEFQAIAFKAISGITKLRLFDVDKQATLKCRHNLVALGFEVECCDSVSEAVAGADIITTITADKQLATIISDDLVEAGVHINAVGGDSPGKTELDPDILRRADIFVEYTPQTRVEGEIQQLPADYPVTEIWQVMRGHAQGRQRDTQITVFDSVGFAVEDYSALQQVYAMMLANGTYRKLELIASPTNPKNLFGEMLSDRPFVHAGNQATEAPPKHAERRLPRRALVV